MQRCRIYFVLIALALLPTLASAEGWTAAAWDFEHTWFASNALVTRPMYGYSVEDVITQTSFTNSIPRLVTKGYTFRGWSQSEMDPTTSGVVSVCYTNVYTNNLHPFDCRITTRAYSTNFIYATNAYVFGSVTGGVITVLHRTETGMYATNILMQLDTLRDYEMYMAIWERARATKNQSVINAALYLKWSSGLYRLRKVMSWIGYYCAYFLDASWSSSTASNNFDFSSYFASETNFPIYGGEYVGYNYDIPAWNTTNLAVSIGAPSNLYGSIWIYSANVNKHKAPSGEEYGRAVTSEVNIIKYPGVVYLNDPNLIITNIAYRYDGTTTNVSGTNGQLVSFITANTNYIIEGFTEWDYGYRYVTSTLSRMVLVKDTPAWSTNGTLKNYEYSEGPPDSQYDSFKSLFDESDHGNTSYWGSSSSVGTYDVYCKKDVYPHHDDFFGSLPYDDDFFGSTPFGACARALVTENKIIHTSSYSLTNSTFVGYDVDFYIAMKMPRYVTSSVSCFITTEATPTGLSYATISSLPLPISAEQAVYETEAYRGFIGSSSVLATGTVAYSEMIYGINILSTLVSDGDISMSMMVGYNPYQTNDIDITKFSYEALPSGTKSPYTDNAGDIGPWWWAIFGRTRPEYTPYVIRNYAVTNGFKYY